MALHSIDYQNTGWGCPTLLIRKTKTMEAPFKYIVKAAENMALWDAMLGMGHDPAGEIVAYGRRDTGYIACTKCGRGVLVHKDLNADGEPVIYRGTAMDATCDR